MGTGDSSAVVRTAGIRPPSARNGSAAFMVRRRIRRDLLGTTALVGAAVVGASLMLGTEPASAACTIGAAPNTVDCLANTTTTNTTNTNATLTTSTDR